MVLDVAIARPTKTTSSFGKYTLLRRIAAGGMGELFLARAGARGPLVVIKRILPHLADQADLVTMFLDESRTAAALRHPHICAVHELGRIDDQHYMALEYLEGATLAALIAASAVAPELSDPRLVIPLLAQIADALHHAHDLHGADGRPLGLIHRDVNPRNIVVTIEGVAKLVDFGVAKARTSQHETATGEVKGTYEYMSPEQLEGKPLDLRCDIFSLGAVAWEAVTGRRLFRRPTEILTWSAILKEPIPPVAHLRPDLPGPLAEAIDGALSRDRARRPGSARELGEELLAGLGAPPLSARQISAVIGRAFERAADQARAEPPRGRDRPSPAAARQIERWGPRDIDWSDESGPSTRRDLPRLARASSELDTPATAHRQRAVTRHHEPLAPFESVHDQTTEVKGRRPRLPDGSMPPAVPPTPPGVPPVAPRGAIDGAVLVAAAAFGEDETGAVVVPGSGGPGTSELAAAPAAGPSGWWLVVAFVTAALTVALGALGLMAQLDDVLRILLSSRVLGG